MNTKRIINHISVAALFLFLTFQSALGGTIYVDASATGANNGSSWANAYIYLQDALTAATNNDQIWVAQGTYKPDKGNGITPGDRNATFQLKNDVSIYGGFPTGGGSWEEHDPNLHETILSGDLNGDDGPNFANNSENSYHVVSGSGTNTTALIDGFTITRGNTTGSTLTSAWGGGMYNDSGGPKVVRCLFLENYASSSGGAMANENNSSPVVEKCIFRENHSLGYGGGVFARGDVPVWSNPTIKDCTFINNYSLKKGGGMYAADCTVIQCDFLYNEAGLYGGGLYLSGNWDGPFTILETHPTVTNGTFIGNIGGTDGGGAICIYVATYPKFVNCKFAGNYTEGNGGAIFVDAFNPYPANIYLSITNCSFSGNKASGIGGACTISCDDIAETTIKNSILWSNVDSVGSGESSQVSGGTLIVSSSCIQDDDPDDGYIPFGGATNHNIDDNPRFMRDPNDGGDGWGVGNNDDFGDLHLSHNSPCIDAGDNTAIPADIADLDGDGNITEPTSYDLDGHPRIVDGDCNSTSVVDMGAYEFAYLYLGDFAGGCDVDFADFAVFALAWLTEEGQAGYNPNCDIAFPYDKTIDGKDLQVFTENWLLNK